MDKEQQIHDTVTATMEDIREMSPQLIFEMWMHERRQWQEERERLLAPRVVEINRQFDEVFGVGAVKAMVAKDD